MVFYLVGYYIPHGLDYIGYPNPFMETADLHLFKQTVFRLVFGFIFIFFVFIVNLIISLVIRNSIDQFKTNYQKLKDGVPCSELNQINSSDHGNDSTLESNTSTPSESESNKISK